MDIIELKPSDNISIVRSCGGVKGLPMSTQKWPKWAKMPSIGKRGKNDKKNDEKNEVVPDFLLKINAPILQPPHYAGKKKKKMPWGGS